MQKVVNVIALLSGLVSASVLAGGGYLYLNKDAIMENAKAQATAVIAETVAGALPSMVQKSMPSVPQLPTKTGPALPF